jgi:anaerobic nitric oxide reductase flavorubredoxin
MEDNNSRIEGGYMKPDKIVDGVYRVAAAVGEKDLFEGIWPIDNGVMLNSYVVQGSEKTAFIDLVKDWDGALSTVEKQLAELDVTIESLDYLILNHMEPDHTGSLGEVFKRNPNIQIVCTKKAEALVNTFYNIYDHIHVVVDGDTIDLGGKTLVFYETPNIHWPETMMTYLLEDKILFSCDAFGSFGRYEHAFDDELTQQEWDLLIPETQRYYANIVSTFSPFVIKGIEKLASLDIQVVAPSHGVIWREDPQKIIGLYNDYAHWMNGPANKEVTFIYSTMYGNTAALVDLIKTTLEDEGIVVHLHQVPQEHVSYVLSSAWRSSGLVIGMPTYEYRMFPPMYHVLDILDRSHLKNRKVIRFGSYGWSGGAQKQFEPFIDSLKWDKLGVIEYQGAPSEEDKQKAVEAAKALAQAVKEWN